jgi:ABC-type sugar transport system ATPase subunit
MLSVEQVSKSYDGNPALKNISFAAGDGRVVALCGENGAGKSTMMKILAGATAPDSGTIIFDGQKISFADPSDAIGLGIRTVYQELSLLPHISVAENMMLGRMPARGPRWLVDWRATERAAAGALAGFGFPDIDVRARVDELPVSLQQVVEIAKALVEVPRILILDEPTSVLSVRETERLFAKIRELKARGTTVLYISHRLEEIFDIADDIVVLKDGVGVLTCEIGAIDRDRLITAMVGRSLEAIYPPRRPAAGRALLEVRGLSQPGVFEDISFDVRAGEIVGVFGLVGSGRTDVARAIFGAAPTDIGEVTIDGSRVAIRTPSDAIRHGVALVTEDRKRDGLLLEAGTVDNGSLAAMGRFASRGVLDRRRQSTVVSAKLDELAMRPRGMRGPVRALSGGNQQKVVLAKWMLVEGARVFIFDEPTRGVDIATKVQIYRMIADLASGGAAVLLISSEMPEILGLSDRVLVMRQGRIAAELAHDALSMEAVFAHAAGIDMRRSA